MATALDPVVNKFISGFNSVSSSHFAVPLSESPFANFPIYGSDDVNYIYDIYAILPRVAYLEKWMLTPGKNTNIYLFGKDEIAQMITDLHISNVVGDGMNVKVFFDIEHREQDVEMTELCQEWMSRPSGAGPDDMDKTVDSFIIPKIITDNVQTGECNFHRFIGTRGISNPVDIGKFMINWLEPRTLVRKQGPHTKQTSLIQYPVVQSGYPKDREGFAGWNPTVMSFYQQHYNYALSEILAPIEIPSKELFRFNLFHGEIPMNHAIQDITSKISMKFLEDKFLEKATYPFFYIKVPRNMQRDGDDDKFDARLSRTSKLINKFRAGDVFAVEGERYRIGNTGEKQILDEGWEIQPIDLTKAHIDFGDFERRRNESIAHALRGTMAMITSIGVQGRSTTLTTGGQINANMQMIYKQWRISISNVFGKIFRDLMKVEAGRKVPITLIEISFTKNREEDAAQFLNQMISLNGIGAMTTNEVRKDASRIGMELKPLPPEMTPEGQTALGLDDLLNRAPFVVPPIFLESDIETTQMEKELEEMK